jgi:hypothetical protein
MATNPLHNPTRALSHLAKKWRGPALQRPLWSIIDWSIHFENSHTRKLTRLPFVLLPTKHDGKGYRRVMRHTGNTAIFTAWVLMTQLAAKTPARGFLADEDGPYTSIDMADMTGIEPAVFDLALSVLASEEIRWMEKMTVADISSSPDYNPQSPDNLPQSPDSDTKTNDLQHKGDSPDNLPTTRENVGAREEKRREEKRREEYPYRPQGDNKPVSSETETAEKKEGGRAAARIASEAGVRILAMFPGARDLNPASFGQLLEHVATGTLPADEKKWRALEAMRAERAAIEGIPDDYDLRAAWLISKERLCRDLPEALETALAKRPQRSALPPEPKKEPTPADWQKKLVALYPNAHVPTDFYELPPEVRDEVKAGALLVEGGKQP